MMFIEHRINFMNSVSSGIGSTSEGRFKVLYGVNKKDQSHMYFAYSVKTGYPYATWKGNEEFDFKKMCMLDDLKEECDIVRMAERRKEE